MSDQLLWAKRFSLEHKKELPCKTHKSKCSNSFCSMHILRQEEKEWHPRRVIVWETPESASLEVSFMLSGHTFKSARKSCIILLELERDSLNTISKDDLLNLILDNFQPHFNSCKTKLNFVSETQEWKFRDQEVPPGWAPRLMWKWQIWTS